MKIDGRHYRTIWLNEDGRRVDVIDQTLLPHRFVVKTLAGLDEAADAIRTMVVRGAPLIGAAAAYGLALAMAQDASDVHLDYAAATLMATRPTAVNLRWAVERLRGPLAKAAAGERPALAYAMAGRLADEDAAANAALGEAGLAMLRPLAAAKSGAKSGATSAAKSGAPLNVLTHCNAGWLAAVDWGTALAPVYAAHDAGLPIHVFVDETRPRNQGASLTAFELAAHGVPHTLIADNAGGHLMLRGEVDLCIVGADRVTADGAVCNKIGTYLKALAARDNAVPFFAAFPGSTYDRAIARGADVPIEERSSREVTHLTGLDAAGALVEVALAPPGTVARNPAFDVTPPHLVTGYVTERGVAPAGPDGLKALFG